ncbi:apiosidase-like domain-containing protein [Flavilitoribacter nigricans]|uniref:DUF4038 domain-containing protein n=1 Tax=Flavilitoribacter nigricans (strain ATCC 23147 / DSM 23189 / NBRC 102662 / NCIMB 1420 / SS-2) TaxID=1122177 RepID=A0A2D0NAV7_FLAN2|nr:DUF4038 domain-containing protein [Flavilitoribacter nigricans]PHN05651.1 hypothetical protein CRP01_14300 [Flavilitoribacter nigricans DSM 23189 = NBRC 102662]
MRLSILLFFLLSFFHLSAQDADAYPIWGKVELNFQSNRAYDNVLYDVREFRTTFTAPSGRTFQLDGFWDGGTDWRVRFCPDETGVWTYQTSCSDKENTGLHDQKGTFTVIENSSSLPLYRKGMIGVSKGAYHLTYGDGTPFFWTACTAWNGALKSTPEEWDRYLTQRKENHYNVIQVVTTQWRGCERNAEDQVAFTGSGRIQLNPDFFRRIDERIDAINEHGLVASPVLLWALPFGNGRELSPGYYLPKQEAVLLAKYIVARLQGNHVIWTLGGDGRYTDDFEQRWKYIGREVFSENTQAPVTLHPHGRSWIGELYEDEAWLDIIAYQSSHSNAKGTVDWITQGPMANQWDRIPARPLINMEPNYEEINFRITAEDVRNASYWSIFATPISGISYGANGIWPWIQTAGELIENHGNPDGRGPSTWDESMEFPGSKQIGLLSAFIQEYDWWTLKPAQELLIQQPGTETFNAFISVVSDDRKELILVYTPKNQAFSLRLAAANAYRARWFDPLTGQYRQTGISSSDRGRIGFTPPRDQDWVLVLEKQ